jgi:hypothetical protein
MDSKLGGYIEEETMHMPIHTNIVVYGQLSDITEIFEDGTNRLQADFQYDFMASRRQRYIKRFKNTPINQLLIIFIIFVLLCIVASFMVKCDGCEGRLGIIQRSQSSHLTLHL